MLGVNERKIESNWNTWDLRASRLVSTTLATRKQWYGDLRHAKRVIKACFLKKVLQMIRRDVGSITQTYYV